MAQVPSIPTPREHIGEIEIGADGKPTGKITATRPWWRFWNSSAANSGSLNQPVTIAPNSIVTPGTINSGSTVTLVDSPPLTVLGNSSNVAAAPVPQVVDPSLSFNGGTLAIRSIPAGTLSGNPGPGAAPPGAIIIGEGLGLVGNVLTTATAPTALPAVFAPLVNGDLPGSILIGYPDGMIKGPTPISDAVGQFVMVQVR